MPDKEIIPLSIPSLKGNELKYLSECIETGWVSSAGSFVNRFEQKVAEHLEMPHAVACINGTSALHIALLLGGVKSGEEVIVPTLTFIAPTNTVRYVGATPVFMDCDDHLNIDPNKLEEFLQKRCDPTPEGLRNRATGRLIRAILPVHIFGHPVVLEPILALAKKFELKIIEDATESLGSYYRNIQGRKRGTGTLGDFGCFSFNGNKIITTGGGGMIVTRDPKAAERARFLTTQAKTDPLYSRHDEIGYNYRMTNLQAALGVAQMEKLDDFVKIKRGNFERYEKLLGDLPQIHLIREPAFAHSNYWHYSLVVKADDEGQKRDRLMAHLKEKGIETRPVWALGHKQKPYRHCESYRIEKAEHYERQVLNLPCSVSLKDEQIERVCETIRRNFL